MAITWKEQIKLMKDWGIGDLIKQEAGFPLDGTAEYNHIEALTGSDPDNHVSIRRSVRNLIENEERLKEFFNAIVKNMAASPNNSAVIPAVLNELEVKEEDIITSIDENKIYVRVRPGVAIVATDLKTIDIGGSPFDYVDNFIPVVVKPQISIAERELEKIFNLQTWHAVAEGVEIAFNENECRFHAQIKKKNTSGQLQTYNFINDAISFKDFSVLQATLSLVANSGASVSISASPDGEFSGIKGNGIEIVFVDSGVGGLDVTYDAGTITIDFGGADASALDIATQINSLEGFDAEETVAGDFVHSEKIAVPEITTVETVADVSGSLDGTYFTISSPTDNYYVWMDVDSAGNDPELIDAIAIPISVTTNDSANAIAGYIDTALTALNGGSTFSTSVISNEVTIENVVAGDANDANAETSGFTITTTQQGRNEFLGVLTNGTIGGFENSIKLLEAIKNHPEFSYSFNNRVSSLNSIQLEPIFEVPFGEVSVIRYIGIDITGELKIVDNIEDVEVGLCSFNLNTTDINNIIITTFTDIRDYFSDVLFRHNVRILGNFTVAGDFQTEGESSIVETHITLNNIPELERPDYTAMETSGIRIIRGNLEDDYLFEFRQSDETFTIGRDSPGQIQAVATRQDTPVNMGLPYWNNSIYRFDTTNDLTWNNSTKILNADKIISNSFNRVAITAPASASTLTIANNKTLTASATTTLGLNSITLENTKSLTIQHASLTIGDAVGTGNLTIKSNNATAKTITFNENLNVNALTNGHVLFAGNTNVISGEAQLNSSRGGTGVDNGGRTLTINNNNKTISGVGNEINISNDFITSGNHSITLNTVGTTSITIPTTGTLATLNGLEDLTQKTINGLSITTDTDTFTLIRDNSSIVKTGAHSLTLTTTAITSATFPSGNVTLAGRNVNNTFSGFNTFTGNTEFINTSNIFRRSSVNDGIEIEPRAIGGGSKRIKITTPSGGLVFSGSSLTYAIPDVGANADFVMNAGNQDIFGIKDFKSIPILPSTNPTNINHAVRKGYVDNSIKNSTLTLQTSGIATGSQTWTANQGTDTTFTVNVPGTNLGIDGSGNSRIITSSTGNNVTIPIATTTNAGFMSIEDKQTIDNVSLTGFLPLTGGTLSGNLSMSGGHRIITSTGGYIMLRTTSGNNSAYIDSSGTGSIFLRPGGTSRAHVNSNGLYGAVFN